MEVTPNEGRTDERTPRLLSDEAGGRANDIPYADAPLAVLRPPVRRHEPGRQGDLYLPAQPLPALPQEWLGERLWGGIRHLSPEGAGEGTAGV